MTPPVQFTCEHCHQPVPFMDAGLHHYEHRNHCPYCLHSKHIMFGTATLKPCDALMYPITPAHTETGQPMLLVQVCEDCGFRWVTYLEDHWATLPPARQTEIINAAWTETERLNSQPTIIHRAKALYATQPPPIPTQALHARTRVKRRP